MLYSERHIPVKGVGCIARTDIQPGQLLVSEEPALVLQPQDKRNYLNSVLNAFQNMSETQQAGYLALSNKYDMAETGWSDYSRQMKRTREEEMKSLTLLDITQETAHTVWQILETNSFQNGVFLKIARFNHSCRPNCEFTWNLQTKRREIWTECGVREGEELTINYSRLDRGVSTRQRRTYLRELFHFECACELCDKTEQEIEEEEREIEIMRDKEREEDKKEEEYFLCSCNFSDIDLVK
eukprot:GFUD01003104.1.p1 GENE.GFUD01003104.1~~GFUD01003104.1.p1  ORF type:complete len:240 (-),score=65.47 GFUD01003104.1:111-830(-)